MFKSVSSKKFQVVVLAGGPSLERGISLNSARSVLDHLSSDSVEIVPIYFDHYRRAYKISKAQLYSNNPSDFDFKLNKNSRPLTAPSLVKFLKSADIVFPAMHGAFGEDGAIQKFLEENKVPFIGSGSVSCKKAFDKFQANNAVRKANFYTMRQALLKIYDKNNPKIIRKFFKVNKVKRAIVKPATGGSSIGTFSVNSAKEAIESMNLIFSKRIDTRVVLEPFVRGKEFTVIILQNKFGLPVAIMPTEVEMTYRGRQIFDFRRKYLPTNRVKYHCPPRFSEETVNKIRAQAKQIFALFNMKDFARFDGWILPNGKIWFSDLNPISGMEQNSFLFQQASRLGMSHSDLLNYIVKNSCRRQGIKYPEPTNKNLSDRRPVSIIFGGCTSERQTSLMTGTNVWLKLRKSKIYEPRPYLLDFENSIWKLPYTLILNHTVEEIIESAKNAEENRKKNEKLINFAKTELALNPGEFSEPFFIPKKMSLSEFSKKSKFVFLGLHGGDGENGNFQKFLTSKGIKFNGSSEKVSRICMDKWEAGELIRNLNMKDIDTPPQKVVRLSEIRNVENLWRNLCMEFSLKTLIIKPRSDGCSTGIAHLGNSEDLEKYLSYVKRGTAIPSGVLSKHRDGIEMPVEKGKEILFEKFVETDSIKVRGNKLKYHRKNGWIEVTIGLLEEAGRLTSFNPSITIAEGEILSVEEKFQGGTGVNITPPPKEIIKLKTVNKVKKLAETLARKIGLKGYARIDAFMNVTTGELLIIEVNTLPGLTPSTVYFHQALAENPPIYPLQLLEKIIKNAGY